MEKTELVRVRDFLPEAVIDLKYAGEDNFTGRRIYDFDEAYLRYGTVLRLAGAEQELCRTGYRLLIWDAWRPQSAQRAFWEVLPDDTFVADPVKGHSRHTAGSAADVSLADRDGTPLEMPCPFDTFSEAANRAYAACSPAARNHALFLEGAMVRAGFLPLFDEWWHFVDPDPYDFIEEM